MSPDTSNCRTTTVRSTSLSSTKVSGSVGSDLTNRGT